MAQVVTVNDVLDGHVALDIECLDRPLPLTFKDRDAGYWRETSMRQVEISRTIAFDARGTPTGSSRPWSPTTSTSAPRTTSRSSSAAGSARDTRGTFRTATGPLRQRRRHRECVLQALADQAIPQRRPGDADRDRHHCPRDLGCNARLPN